MRRNWTRRRCRSGGSPPTAGFRCSPVNGVRNAVAHGMEVSIQHNRFGPGEATAGHIHPGPTTVTVVRGAMTYQRPVGGACRSDTYVAGTGFTDRGGGKGHGAVAGSEG